MFKKIHLFILGSVQGVSYRVNSQKKADELKLVGWVKNTIDGKVEILAEGEEKNLKNMISWCYNGSDKAIVSEIKVKREEHGEKFDKFEILL